MNQAELFRPENLLPYQGSAVFYAGLFSEVESKEIFCSLVETTQWKHEPILLFGKRVLQPRLTAWYGDRGKEYRYSGTLQVPLPWTKTLLVIKSRVEEKCQTSFNSALLNYYRDEKDSMGWHRDNEKELGAMPTIASVSFGATRTFQIRNYREKSVRRDVDLSDGSLLIMSGEMQENWEHCIPKRARVIGPRINITFRYIQNRL